MNLRKLLYELSIINSGLVELNNRHASLTRQIAAAQEERKKTPSRKNRGKLLPFPPTTTITVVPTNSGEWLKLFEPSSDESPGLKG